MHYNKKYGSLGNATSHPDGLAVLGVFVEVLKDKNERVDCSGIPDAPFNSFILFGPPNIIITIIVII